MDITPSQSYRLRSRSRTRTSANSRSTSASRRPLGGSIRSLSSSSLNKIFTPVAVEVSKDSSVPSISAMLDNSLPLDFFKQEIIGLIKALRISKWHKRQLCAADMVVTRILGALTNSIYKIEYKDAGLAVPIPSLLLRVYGKNVDELIDRDSELKTLIKLSAKKIGPKLLGIFTNGRFEQFLEGFLTMGKEEIRDPVISQMIGRRMKNLHSMIELDDADKALDLPIAWVQLIKWINLFETSLLPTYPDEKAIEDILLVPWKKFRELVFAYQKWLLSKYDERNISANYRFCHNDTQYGNLLLRSSFDSKDVIQESDSVLPSTSNKRDQDLAVIDFEYSGPNFPAFDIANHFSEWMSDYHDEEKPYYIHEDKYPTQLEQLNLIKSYVEYDFQYPSTNLKTNSVPSINDTDVGALMEYEVKKLYNEVIYWRMSVQILWLIWGLIQHGPMTSKDLVELLSSRKEEQGINSTYNITTGLDAVSIDGSAILEEVDETITSTDDDFDYLKYSQQKAALVMGDMISFGFASISEVAPEYHNIIKFLDSQAYDV